MIRRKAAVAGTGLAVAFAAIAALAFGRSASAPEPAAPPAQSRPELMLLTSLPLMFGEGFGLDQAGSPALTALERHYRVRPISVADTANLGRGRLLLMAQPQAQPAEVLVELDAWVRGGGRVLLLADPLLEWPSQLPLGDARRPVAAFADTGLLGHWGLRLHAPDERGPRQIDLRGRAILTASPGSLSGRCAIVGKAALAADCRVDRGRATVIADADFLNVGSPEGLDGPTDGNLPALVAELARLAAD